MESKVFVISGKSGHGKDVFANLLAEQLKAYQKKVMIIHYGDLVKYYLKQYYNWDGNKDEHGRYLLQTLGTDIIRSADPNYWTECVARFIAALQHSNNSSWDYYIIPDARFINEVEITKSLCSNVVTIRVKRINEDDSCYLSPSLTMQQHQHPSETSLDDYEDFDYYVIHKTLKELEESAEVIFKDIIGE